MSSQQQLVHTFHTEEEEEKEEEEDDFHEIQEYLHVKLD